MRRIVVIISLVLAATASGQDMPLSQVLIDGEGWKEVKLLLIPKPTALAVAGDGELLIAEQSSSSIWSVMSKLGLARGKPWTVQSSPGAFVSGRDNNLFVCHSASGEIVEYPGPGGFTKSRKLGGLSKDANPTDIAVSPTGKVYFIDSKKKAVFFVSRKEPVATDIGDPAGIVFWKGGGTLVVGDSAGKHLYAYRVKSDGTLDAKEKYYTLRVRPNEPSGVKALAIDDAKRLYAATNLGVQVFDPTGRMSGVMNSPLREPVTALAFAGEKRDHLYILCGGKLWVRKTKAKGAWPPAAK